MNKNPHNFYVTSANFNGRGRGFAVGFDSEKAAHLFADIFLLGFAEVLPWYLFENLFPNYKKD